MRLHPLLVAFLVALLTAAHPAAALLGPSPLERLGAGSFAGRNVLIVTLDTTRADHLGCYGDARAETPALDRIAGEGLRFDAAFSAVPVTLPSHATLFTGLYPPRHGARMNAEFRVDPHVPTMAEAFQGKGYDTAAFVSSFVLDERYGLSRGFDLYDDRVAADQQSGFPSGTPERKAGATVDAFLRWLGARGAGRPFFAWVHFFDPHAPYEPPAPHAQRFASRPYDGEIAYVDAQVARLRAALEERSLWNATVVVVAGDHGESLGEHGELTHSLFLYDAVMRVPLLLRLPGKAVRGVVADRVVSLADLFPTLAGLLKVPPPSRSDGFDLVATRAHAGRALYMESVVSWVDFGWAPLAALRRLKDKSILAPRPEYYRLRTDPGETKNLSLDATPGIASPRAELADKLRRLVAKWTLFPQVHRGARGEEVANLQALGYLSGAGPGGKGPLADPKDKAAVASALIEANGELAQGRAEGALLALGRLAAGEAEDRSVLYARAKAFLRLGRHREAERDLRAFRSLRPKADASILLAQLLILRGETLEAGTVLDEAIRLEPAHGGAFIARGDLLAREGRKDLAEAEYRRAVEVDPYRAAKLARARLDALGRP